MVTQRPPLDRQIFVNSVKRERCIFLLQGCVWFSAFEKEKRKTNEKKTKKVVHIMCQTSHIYKLDILLHYFCFLYPFSHHFTYQSNKESDILFFSSPFPSQKSKNQRQPKYIRESFLHCRVGNRNLRSAGSNNTCMSLKLQFSFHFHVQTITCKM